MSAVVTMLGKETAEDLCADGLMTIPEFMAFARLSRSTCYGILDGGHLPYVRVGRSRRIPRRAAVAFCARNMTGGFAAGDNGTSK